PEGAPTAFVGFAALQSEALISRGVAGLVHKGLIFVSRDLELAHCEAYGNLHPVLRTLGARALRLAVRGAHRVLSARHHDHLGARSALPEAILFDQSYLALMREWSVVSPRFPRFGLTLRWTFRLALGDALPLPLALGETLRRPSGALRAEIEFFNQG